jgi:hypothetical protein
MPFLFYIFFSSFCSRPNFPKQYLFNRAHTKRRSGAITEVHRNADNDQRENQI